MSALSVRGGKQSTAPVVAIGLPQVNLLPPSIRAKRALGRTKRMLAYALVGVVVLLGLAAAYAVMHKEAQESRLDTATAETTRLMKQQAEYAEVPRVLGQVDKLNQVLVQGFSTDVDWGAYMAALAAVLPKDVHMRTMAMTGATPMLAPSEVTDALAGSSVATLTFDVEAPTVPDTAAWVDGLNSIPGFQDARVSNATWTIDETESYYLVTGTVNLTSEAYTGRFSTPEDGE